MAQLDMGAHAYNPSTLKAKLGGSPEFETNLYDIGGSCVKERVLKSS